MDLGIMRMCGNSSGGQRGGLGKVLKGADRHQAWAQRVWMLMVMVLLAAWADAPATEQIVRLDLDSANPAQIEELFKGHPDILGGGEGWVDILGHESAIESYVQMGFRSEILIQDAREYERELRDRDYFDHYHDYQEVLDEILQIEQNFPGLVKIHDIGDSWEKTQGIADRDIWAVKISDNVETFEREEAEVLIMSELHAREIITPEIALHLIHYLADNYGTDPRVTELVDGRQIWIVPSCNPDGLDYVHHDDIWWRKNRRDNGDGTFGVDLNRNFGYAWGYDDEGSSPYSWSETYRGAAPFSEPETQVIRDFVESHNFIISLSYHSYWNQIFYPWGYIPENTPDHPTFVAIAESCTAYNGYLHGNTASGSVYPTNGDSDDWLYGEQTTKYKIFAFTPEVGGSADGFHPDTTRIDELIGENLGANLYVVEAVEEYSPRPVIEHQRVADTEDVIGPYHVLATITSPLWPLDSSSLRISYHWDDDRFTEVSMTPTGFPDEYEGWIQGQGTAGVCSYYISASDSIPRTGYAPPGAPEEGVYQFIAGPDPVPPELFNMTQLPPALTIPDDTPRLVEIHARDNIGLDLSSGVLYYQAGEEEGDIAMDFDEWIGNEATMTGLLPAVGTYGDTVRYYCSIADTAVVPNTGWSDTLCFVYGLEEFEGGFALWDPGISWAPLFNSSAHSGEWVATDSPAGPYGNNEDNSLTLINALDLSGSTTARLSFWVKYGLEQDHDFLYVEASENGIVWERLLAFTGREITWAYSEVLLDGFVGEGADRVQIRFRLVSDEEEVDFGVLLDDVYVENNPALSVSSPTTLPDVIVMTASPNPTQGSTRLIVRGTIDRSRIHVYDVAGRLVKTLTAVDGARAIRWDGRDSVGNDVSSGLYFARLDGSSANAKVVVLR